MHVSEIQNIVADYLEFFPGEAGKLQQLQNRLTLDEQFNHRKSFSGHGTGGAFVLSPEKKELLLIHHAFLDMWIQPGGHWDPEDADPWTVAEREAVEETGVKIAYIIPPIPNKPHIPFDIDSHTIKANLKKDEPEHYHHDFRYAFVAKDKKLTPQLEEVHACRWVSLDDKNLLPHMQKLIAKMRMLKIAP
jgi:8-oxo-dGTP pyrophosphatase MutT (NUDIX family)